MPIIGRPTGTSSERATRHDSTSREQPSKWASTKRVPTGAWSRLKPAPRDDLAEYGFPSKGETRLNNSKAQEAFFHTIFERYMRFCHEARKDLANEFSKLSVTPSNNLYASKYAPKPSTPQPSSVETTTPSLPSTIPAPPEKTTEPSPELILIHTAMRKLRESLLATRRTDHFARSTYLFLARAAILSRSWEAYVPALSHLVYTIHPASPLSDAEWKEVTIYQVLDLACRQHDLSGAIALHKSRKLQDIHTSDVLKALVRDEWLRFWRAKRCVDGYCRALMEFAEDGVRTHALKCLARSYFTVERTFVESTAGRGWDELVEMGIGWEVVSDEMGRESVIVRRAKAR